MNLVPVPFWRTREISILLKEGFPEVTDPRALLRYDHDPCAAVESPESEGADAIREGDSLIRRSIFRSLYHDHPVTTTASSPVVDFRHLYAKSDTLGKIRDGNAKYTYRFS